MPFTWQNQQWMCFLVKLLYQYDVSTIEPTIREKKSWHTSVLLQYYSRFKKLAVEIHQ